MGRGPEAPGQVVLALAVDDVEAAVAEPRTAGVPIIKEPWGADVCYRALTQGPDGNVHLLWHRKDGTAG